METWDSIHERWLVAKEQRVEYSVNEKGCYICTSHRANSAGYPIMTFQGRKDTINRHIMRYEKLKAPISKGGVVRHTCDDKLCINPDHLLLGTQSDNMMDAYSQGKHSWQGPRRESSAHSKLTEKEVIEILNNKERTNVYLAHIYNVSPQNISSIKKRETWKEIVI